MVSCIEHELLKAMDQGAANINRGQSKDKPLPRALFSRKDWVRLTLMRRSARAVITWYLEYGIFWEYVRNFIAELSLSRRPHKETSLFLFLQKMSYGLSLCFPSHRSWSGNYIIQISFWVDNIGHKTEG